MELARSGRAVSDLAREFEPSAQTIASWVSQSDADSGRGSTEALSTDERDELRKLRREVKRLEQEREILKKAAAWFARESDALPKTRSNS